MNWDKHELIVKKDTYTKIWELKLPDSDVLHRLTFINSCGVMTVTGDFGNFVFCREFWPIPEGGVSEGYWLKKLKSKSCQNPRVFSARATEELLDGFISELLDGEHGDFSNEEDTLRDIVSDIQDINIDDNEDFVVNQIRDVLENYEFEVDDKIPFLIGYEYVDYLQTVFDGFNEICRRLREEDIESTAVKVQGDFL